LFSEEEGEIDYGVKVRTSSDLGTLDDAKALEPQTTNYTAGAKEKVDSTTQVDQGVQPSTSSPSSETTEATKPLKRGRYDKKEVERLLKKMRADTEAWEKAMPN
jgi:hypothetical protein